MFFSHRKNIHTVSMNVDAMGEHCRTLFVIDGNIAIRLYKTNKEANKDLYIKDIAFHIYLCIVTNIYYNMYLTCGKVRRTWIESVRKILMIYREL